MLASGLWRLGQDAGGREGVGADGGDGEEDELAAAVCDDAGEACAGVCSAYLDVVEVAVEFAP